MQSGYVKIWRKAIDNGWLQNHKLWAFWCWCLMKATHKEYDQIVGCQQVHLMPGSFVFGRKAAAKETNISEQSIRTLLDFLKTSGNLTINPTNKYSIISITNWDTYQNEDIKINQQINQQLTNNQPTTNHKQTQKNKRNINNNIPKISFAENINLTQKEYDSLISLKGMQTVSAAITYLSEYKIEKNYKTRSDYLTIKRWVFDAVEKKQGGNNGNQQRTGNIRGNPRELSPEAADIADQITREYREAKRLAAVGKTEKDTG